MTLSRKQLNAIAALVEARRSVLLEEVRDEIAESRSTERDQTIDHLPSGEGDESIGDSLAELNLVTMDRHVHEIRELEAALERIRGSDFGTCLECGEDIGLARLKSCPTATRCIVCQERRERVFAHEAHATL